MAPVKKKPEPLSDLTSTNQAAPVAEWLRMQIFSALNRSILYLPTFCLKNISVCIVKRCTLTGKTNKRNIIYVKCVCGPVKKHLHHIQNWHPP